MTNNWSPYSEYYLFVCDKCKFQIMNLLEESVSIPMIYDNGCNTYYQHASYGCISIYGLAKRNSDTWKLSNSTRRALRREIINRLT